MITTEIQDMKVGDECVITERLKQYKLKSLLTTQHVFAQQKDYSSLSCCMVVLMGIVFFMKF